MRTATTRFSAVSTTYLARNVSTTNKNWQEWVGMAGSKSTQTRVSRDNVRQDASLHAF